MQDPAPAWTSCPSDESLWRGADVLFSVLSGGGLTSCSLCGFQIFPGNDNPTDEARSFLPKQTLARYVRVRPISWEQGICMRFEVYGCRTSGGCLGCSHTCT